MKKSSVIVAILMLVILAACSKGSDLIYFTSDRDGNMEIYSIDPDSGEELNITDNPEDEYSPVISPNREWLAFLVGNENRSSIDVLNLDNRERFTITKGTGKFLNPRWSPDSKRVVFLGIHADKGARVYITEVEQILPARVSDIEAVRVGDWSSDGESVIFSSEDGERTGIHVRNPDGVNQRQMTCAKDYGAMWSPDSRQMVFLSERDGNPDVYVMDRDALDELCAEKKDVRSEAYQLTETDEAESDVSWSPDGKWLLFVSERDGNKEIYVMEGSGNKQSRLTYNEIPDYQPVWSPDGRRIVFVSELDGDPDIFMMNDKGEDQVRLTNNDEMDLLPDW